MKIVFSDPGSVDSGALVVGVQEGLKLTPSARALDKRMKGGLKRAFKASTFKGKKGQSLSVLAPQGTRLDRVIVAGLGRAGEVNRLAMQELGGRICAALGNGGSKAATFFIDALDKVKLTPAEMAVALAEGARLRSYRFEKYRTRKNGGDNNDDGHSKPALRTLTFRCKGAGLARAAFRPRDKVAAGVFMTRDLVTEPPNVIYPETLAKRCRELTRLGVKVEVLGEAQMKRLGMGALLGVGQGSARESKLVVMRWAGLPKGRAPKKGPGAKAYQPVCFVGKGVTFDTGGISLKPSGGMEDMKYDMGGSGVVIGLMKALAGRKARVNVVGVVALAENMPGSAAQRPSDVVTSMSGQTIEVLNTDAEGRLVLADALHYANDRFKPRFIVDLATLTGAIIVSLGSEYAGLFAANDKLAEQLTEAGKSVGERVWRMPLGEEYDRLLKSDIADMKNISGGRGGGSITAAQFLKRFVGRTPWAHLDIAGVTWTKKDLSLAPKGATAFGVRLLDRLVADHYEKK